MSKTESILISDGSKFQNYAVTRTGNLKTIEPFCDDILISYIYDEDENGNPLLKPVISTICDNGGYSDLLTQAAHKLLPLITTIQLPMRKQDD